MRVLRNTVEMCKKRLKRLRCHLGWELTLVDPSNHVLDGCQDRMNQFARMRSDKTVIAKLLWVLVLVFRFSSQRI